MKDISKRIFEKENNAEVSNNPKHFNKSLTQLVSLNMINNTRKNEFKGIDIKNNLISIIAISHRPLVFCKPEQRVYTKILSSPIRQSLEKSKDYQSIQLSNLTQNYSEPILEYYLELTKQTPKYSLENHSINAILRAKMIDWIVEVLSSYKYKNQTFYLSVRLMDLNLSKTTQLHVPKDLHFLEQLQYLWHVNMKKIIQQNYKLLMKNQPIKNQQKKGQWKNRQIYCNLQISTQMALLYQIFQQWCYQFQILTYSYMKLLIFQQNYYLFLIINKLYLTMNFICALIISAKTIEQINKNISSEVIIPLIVSTLKLYHQDSIKCANQLLELSKGFEKQFPNLENIQKFSKFRISDIMKTQC